jgi:hypothetical protein
MWRLTWKTLRTAFRNPVNLIKCFYPVLINAALMMGGFAAFSIWFLGSNWLDDANTVQIALSVVVVFASISMAIALSVAASAVHWHRHLILGEPLSWRFPMLPRRSMKYAICLALFLTGYIFIHMSLNFVWHFSLASYLFGTPDNPYPGYSGWILFVSGSGNFLGHFLLFFGPTLASLLFLAIFTFTLGRWMLVLPEIALDEKNHYSWGTGQKVRLSSFLITLYLFYSVPVIASDIASYLASRWKVYHGLDETWQFAVQVPLGIIAPIATLTLLSMTYLSNRNTVTGPPITDTATQ